MIFLPYYIWAENKQKNIHSTTNSQPNVILSGSSRTTNTELLILVVEGVNLVHCFESIPGS